MKRDTTGADALAARFQASRPRLTRIAYRILRSAHEADDAVQESWLRASRTNAEEVENLEGWLTTIVARVCLDALQRRKTRREDFTPADPRTELASAAPGEHPEEEAVLTDSLGVAMTVLLDALTPAERVAFVMHDMFDVPFNDIAEIVGKSPEAARQLASRARRRVRGASPSSNAEHQRRSELVRAFLEASRSGNLAALLALLDPAATLRADAAVMAMGGSAYWQNQNLETGIAGAEAVAETFAGRARAARPAIVDREPGAVWIHEGQPRVAFRFAIAGEKITGIDMLADPGTLERVITLRG